MTDKYEELEVAKKLAEVDNLGFDNTYIGSTDSVEFKEGYKEELEEAGLIVLISGDSDE